MLQIDKTLAAPAEQVRAKMLRLSILLACLARGASMSMGAGNDPKRVWTVKPAAKPAGGAPVPAVPARKDEAAQKALAELQKSRATSLCLLDTRCG